MIDRLETVGFVRRAPAPCDKRKVLLHLTPEGLATMDATYTLYRDALRKRERRCAILNCKAPSSSSIILPNPDEPRPDHHLPLRHPSQPR